MRNLTTTFYCSIKSARFVLRKKTQKSMKSQTASTVFSDPPDSGSFPSVVTRTAASVGGVGRSVAPEVDGAFY